MADSTQTLRFVLFGDDRASSAFQRFARNVDESSRALDRNNLTLDDSKRKFDEISRKADELGKINPTIKVQVDDAAAKLKLDLFREDLKRSLSDMSNSSGGGGGSWWRNIIGSAGGANGAGGTGLRGILAGFTAITANGPVVTGVLVALGAAAALALAPVAAALIPITIGLATFGGVAGKMFSDIDKFFSATSAKQKKAAWQAMDPAERHIADHIDAVKMSFGRLFSAIQPEVVRAFDTGLQILKELMPALKPLGVAAGKAIDGFLQKMSDWLKSPQGQSFVHWLETVGPQDIKNFGRVMWDVAHSVGDALHFIYSTMSWIDRFVTHWHDDWIVVKNVFRLIGDELVIFALQTVQGILTPFTHIPIIGGEFRKARDAVHGELERMLADSRAAASQIQTAFDAIHAHTVPLNVDLNLPSGITLGGSGQKTQRRAAGGLITGGTPGRDSVLGLLMPGELVVPAGMVSSGAVDHLRGRLPGFAGGGLVGEHFRPPVGVFDQRLISTVNADANAIGAYVAAHASLTAALRARLTGGGGAGGGPSPMPGGGNPLANALLAQRMYPPWASGSAWAAWNSVAMRESGWSNIAQNASSGAYGIPQALPFTKMPKAAWPSWAGGSSNPGAQISWMVGYIKSVYGTPQNAWAHELSAGWYDHGGFLPPGVSIAVNGTGRPEPVGFGGNSYTINNNIQGPVTSGQMAEIGRVTVSAIREFERRSGAGWRR